MSRGIDVRSALNEVQQILDRGADPERCFELLTVLWRWQRNPDLTADSRQRAGELVKEYGRHYVPGRGMP